MKKLLLVLYLFLFFVEPVMADSNLQFYCTPKGYVDGMWITRISKSQKISDRPFILKRKSDDTYVYCLEPLVYLNQEEDYTPYFQNDSKLHLDQEDWEYISKLAYFGYLYPGHEDEKWYGVTQYLIWQVVAPDIEMYFANGKNGQKINAYDQEIKEIETLIHDFDEVKKLNHQKLVFHSRTEWSEFQNDNQFLSILKKTRSNGNYEFTLPENKAAFGVDVIYYHSNGQNVYHPGDLLPVAVTFEVEFLKGVIHLEKKNRSDVFVSSQNTLEGAKYGVYQNGVLVDTLITDQEGKATSQPLEYGTYTVKELSASEGYLVDEQEYTIYLNQEDYPLEVYEDQKQKQVTIQKWYGNGMYKLEANATFEIYQEDEFVLEVTTSQDGLAQFTLPYGEYRLHQKTGKEGYYKVEDYYFTIDDSWLDEPIQLYNREIIPDIPDTGLFDPVFSSIISWKLWRIILHVW